ncbi:hypothetical protein Hanom_Chr06g00539551 [Helianthus anomalus]
MSTAQPEVIVLAVLSQIHQIFELTTPRVGSARPRVGYHFCLLQLSFSPAQYPSLDTTRVRWTRPRARLLFLLF